MTHRCLQDNSDNLFCPSFFWIHSKCCLCCRWLYWIDKGGAQYTAYIGRGAMDGDSRSFFVSSNLFSPTGLTVDYQGEGCPLEVNILTNQFVILNQKPILRRFLKVVPNLFEA